MACEKATSYLVHHRFVSGRGDDVISLPGVEVGQSYSFDQTFVHQALHGCPGISVVHVRVTNTAIFSPGHQLLPAPNTATHTHTHAEADVTSSLSFPFNPPATNHTETVNQLIVLRLLTETPWASA